MTLEEILRPKSKQEAATSFDGTATSFHKEQETSEPDDDSQSEFLQREKATLHDFEERQALKDGFQWLLCMEGTSNTKRKFAALGVVSLIVGITIVSQAHDGHAKSDDREAQNMRVVTMFGLFLAIFGGLVFCFTSLCFDFNNFNNASSRSSTSQGGGTRSFLSSGGGTGDNPAPSVLGAAAGLLGNRRPKSNASLADAMRKSRASGGRGNLSARSRGSGRGSG
ncbi:unnamed protein product, partial [Amoebophrya sp. A25]|eukprot:GSA25T00020866001.1